MNTRLYPGHTESREPTFDDRPCRVVSDGTEASKSLFFDPQGQPLGMRMNHGPDRP